MVVKIVLFLFIVVIGLWHDAHARTRLLSEAAGHRFKVIARRSGRLLLLLSLAMAYIGVVLFRGG